MEYKRSDAEDCPETQGTWLYFCSFKRFYTYFGQETLAIKFANRQISSIYIMFIR
jgi:hypothetical protein